jgi:hypothetical protein
VSTSSILWLLIATLWVYLPRYSMTCLGPPKGRFAYTTHCLVNKLSNSDLSHIPCVRNSRTYLARKTWLSALTENRNLLDRIFCCHLPLASIPPPGTIQCRCGCRLRFCPQVCNPVKKTKKSNKIAYIILYFTV